MKTPRMMDPTKRVRMCSDPVRAAWRAYAVARDNKDVAAMAAASKQVKKAWAMRASPARPVTVD